MNDDGIYIGKKMKNFWGNIFYDRNCIEFKNREHTIIGKQFEFYGVKILCILCKCIYCNRKDLEPVDLLCIVVLGCDNWIDDSMKQYQYFQITKSKCFLVWNSWLW